MANSRKKGKVSKFNKEEGPAPTGYDPYFDEEHLCLSCLFIPSRNTLIPHKIGTSTTLVCPVCGKSYTITKNPQEWKDGQKFFLKEMKENKNYFKKRATHI